MGNLAAGARTPRRLASVQRVAAAHVGRGRTPSASGYGYAHRARGPTLPGGCGVPLPTDDARPPREHPKPAAAETPCPTPARVAISAVAAPRRWTRPWEKEDGPDAGHCAGRLVAHVPSRPPPSATARCGWPRRDQRRPASAAAPSALHRRCVSGLPASPRAPPVGLPRTAPPARAPHRPAASRPPPSGVGGRPSCVACRRAAGAPAATARVQQRKRRRAVVVLMAVEAKSDACPSSLPPASPPHVALLHLHARLWGLRGGGGGPAAALPRGVAPTSHRRRPGRRSKRALCRPVFLPNVLP